MEYDFSGYRAKMAAPLGRAVKPTGSKPIRARPKYLRAGHVPVPVGGGAARRTPAGVHRVGHLYALQAAPGIQRAASDGIRRVRAAGRAVCDPDRAASGRILRRRTSTATANSSIRSASVSIGTARCVPAIPGITTGRNGHSSKCSTVTTATTRQQGAAPLPKLVAAFEQGGNRGA